MPQSVLVYFGGECPSSCEERKAHAEKYQRWLISIGDAVVSPAVLLKDPRTVQPDGSAVPGNSTAMSGLSVERAGSMADDPEAAKFCPFPQINGILDLSEMLEISDTAAQSTDGKSG
jgi:hypothetical protein